MKKVFVDDLPKWRKHGKAKEGTINWRECINHRIKFIYDEVLGEFKIINYEAKRQRCTIEYNKHEFEISTGHLTNCGIGCIIGKIKKEYKYNIGDIIEGVTPRKIKILEQIRLITNQRNRRGYKYKCLICGDEDIIDEYHLWKRNGGCKVCLNQKIKKGVNDIWTTNTELAEALLNPEDGYKYTQWSHSAVDWECKNCGNIIRNKRISSVNNNGKIGCPKCSDGISYPNKLMFNALKQLLKDDFETEKRFKWSNNRRYDFYISKLNCIIEIQGLQHSEEYGFELLGGRTLDEEIKNDILKKDLAKANGIKFYIQVDATSPNLEYIKNSILNSKLNNIINFSKINWIECHKYACNSLVKVACDLWNSGIHSTKKIGKIMSIHYDTICIYLKKGNKASFCKYDSTVRCKQIGTENVNYANEATRRKVVCLTSGEIFNSIFEASIKFKISRRAISYCCKGEREFAGVQSKIKEKSKWMYYEDYLKLNNESIS